MMRDERPAETYVIVDIDELYLRRQTERQRFVLEDDSIVDPWSYWAKLGRGRIRLSPIEFRILNFLAARPYRAYSRRRIAEAVSTHLQPVTADMVGRFIHSLRRQLGFYSDYIQRVPYLGYRFKA